MTWQLKDCAPKKGQRLTVCKFEGGEWRYQVVRWEHNKWYGGEVGRKSREVADWTHWQLVPPPPKFPWEA